MKTNNTPRLPRRVGVRVIGGFQSFARTVVRASGHPLAFVIAISIVLIWALMGPVFHFGNTWLLVINTVGTILTFLMIFLVRSAQNRESEAIQLKLDELIRATKAAQNTLLDIEELSEADLDRIKARFERLARTAREESTAGQTGVTPAASRQEAAGDVTPGSP